jgi:hypothetical protein
MDIVNHTKIKEKERLLFALIVILFLYSVLRGIRFPNLWAATHFYFNYTAGFIKRGFIGSVIGWLDMDVLFTYSFFFYFSLVIFAANMVLLMDSTLKLARNNDLIVKASALVFSTGFSLVFLAHTMGYAEHLQLLAVQLLIRIRNFNVKVFLALLTGVILLLIHEAFLLTFLPVLILSLLVGHDDVDTRVKWRVAGSLFLLMSLITLIVNHHVISDKGMIELIRSIRSRVDFTVRLDALRALFRSTEMNMSIMQAAWKKPFFLKHQAASLVLTFPSVLYFMYAAISRLQKKGIPWIGFVIVISSLAPFSLNLFGWDLHRWNTLVIASSYLSLVVITSSTVFLGDTTSMSRGKLWAAVLAALILVMNCSQNIPLFDERTVEHFPFRSHINYLGKVVKGEAPFPQIPDI